MKMPRRNIPFLKPDLGEEEIKEVAEVIRSGWITTGPKVKEFEKRLAEYCGTENMVCLASATAAEELNLRLLGIGEGDEVIVPAYTYTATASAVIHVGAKPIFVDIKKGGDAVTGMPEIDPEKIVEAITPRTKAIVAVDIAGVPCRYDEIFDVARSYSEAFSAKNDIQERIGRIAVLEDAAHALGASYKGKMTGAICDFTSFSFHAVKNFTTAEGGASAWNIGGVDNDAIYHTYQLLSLHGQSKDALEKTKGGSWEYDIVEPWYKCNMTDIMAGIGLAQLRRYEGLLAKRKTLIDKYDKICDGLGIGHLRHFGDDYRSSGHLYLARFEGVDEERRAGLIQKLSEYGIATNVHFKPLPMMSAYKKLGWDIKDFPNAYDYYKNLVTLPLHTLMSEEDVEYIGEVLNELKAKGRFA